MAVAVTGTPTTSKSDSGSATLTWSHTNPADGDLIIVVTGYGRNLGIGSTVSVTFNGDALARILGFISTDSGFVSVEAWYRLAPDVATGNVVITSDDSSNQIGGLAVSFSGVHQTVTFDTVAIANGSSTTPSCAPASASGDLMFYAVMSDAEAGFSAHSGTTIKESAVINSDTITACQSAAGTGSPVTGTWTQASTGWAIGGIAIKPAAAAVVVALEWKQPTSQPTNHFTPTITSFLRGMPNPIPYLTTTPTAVTGTLDWIAPSVDIVWT